MRILLILSTLLFGAVVMAADDDPARVSLDRFTRGLETLRADFTQRVITPDGEVESEGGGEVWLRTPGQFRWAYGGAYPELIVADGEYLWMYDEMLDQVTVKRQSAQAEDSPLMLLTNPDALDSQFTATEVGDYEGMTLLSLVSNNPESEFETVLLGFSEDRLALMALEDAFGLRTEVRFSGVQRNLELDSGLFRFKPPAGADVVGDIPGADQQ